MRRFLAVALILSLAVVPLAFAAWTTEYLVLASAPVTISSVPDAKGLIIQNRGPNSIFCATNNETPVLNKSLEVKTGGSLSLSGTNFRVRCIAATADQVTGAATIAAGVP